LQGNAAKQSDNDRFLPFLLPHETAYTLFLACFQPLYRIASVVPVSAKSFEISIILGSIIFWVTA